MKLPDPGDASGDLHWGVDLVLYMPGSIVDESRSEGTVLNELERVRAHRSGGQEIQQRQM